MSDNKTSPLFTTTDTSLAAYLYTEGFKITDIDYTEVRAVIYFQNDNPKIKDFERLYYIGKTAVDAATYSRNHKRLSTLIRKRIPWQEGVLYA